MPEALSKSSNIINLYILISDLSNELSNLSAYNLNSYLYPSLYTINQNIN